jgi:hypothetical protein
MNVDELLEINQKFRLQIIALRDQAINLENKIDDNEKKIWRLCDHTWEYDTGCGQNASLKYRCQKCQLWRHQYMYQ